RSKAGFSDSPPHWIKRTRRSDAQPPLVLFRLAKATVTWLALVRNHTLHLAGWPRQRISSSGSVSKAVVCVLRERKRQEINDSRPRRGMQDLLARAPPGDFVSIAARCPSRVEVRCRYSVESRSRLPLNSGKRYGKSEPSEQRATRCRSPVACRNDQCR